jgi:hypothetical protein
MTVNKVVNLWLDFMSKWYDTELFQFAKRFVNIVVGNAVIRYGRRRAAPRRATAKMDSKIT